MRPSGRHWLTVQDLRGLADGNGSRLTTKRLRDARLSRQKLLVEAARRAVAPNSAEAWELLARVQARRPDVIEAMFTLPQTSAWAVDGLRARVPDQGYPSVLAVAAAVHAEEPFDLKMAVSGKRLIIPSIGTLHVLDGSTVRLRSGRGRVGAEHGHWVDTPRIVVEAAGLALDVRFETDDAYRARFGARVRKAAPNDLARWRELLKEAWRVIVANDSMLAENLATDMQVIVPLERPPGREPISATSGWTPGAVALSLPDDALSLAATLVHEYRHCVLGTVEDIVPLVDARNDVLCYAPWRDDPRPPAGLVHGCFAHLGITGFWRRQREVGTTETQPRAEYEFARWRAATMTAVTELLESRALTEAGSHLADAMRETLRRWQDEPIPSAVRIGAERANAEHRLRWRLAHLHPDEQVVTALVEDWRAGEPPRAVQVRTLTRHDNGRQVTDRRTTSRLTRPHANMSDSERAWIELARDARPIVEQIEIAVAVYERLRLVGCSTTPDEVLAWIGTSTSSTVQKHSR